MGSHSEYFDSLQILRIIVNGASMFVRKSYFNSGIFTRNHVLQEHNKTFNDHILIKF